MYEKRNNLELKSDNKRKLHSEVRPRNVRTDENRERIRESVEETATTST